jgi:hypothetical protein
MLGIRSLLFSVVMLAGVAVGLVGCSKSAGPLADHPPPASQEASTSPLNPIAQASQAQAPSSTAAGKGKVDTCALLTSSEIKSIQGEPLQDTKSSDRSGEGYGVSQCYFALPTSSKSISLVVTHRGEGPGARDPKQFWKETFPDDKDSEQAREKESRKGGERDRQPGHEKGHDKGREKEEAESAPPLRVARLGDQAFWIGSPVGGALYVLKGNTFIRVSIGGSGVQGTQISKSKALAQMVLKHL